MRILKFGGTSIGTTESFRNVLRIITDKLNQDKIIVVVSALGGITNKLFTAIELATEGSEKYHNVLGEIKSIHYNYLEEFISNDFFKETKNEIDRLLFKLKERLKGTYLLKESSGRITDSVISTGEYLSKLLLVSALKSIGVPAENLDAAKFIRTNSNFGDAEVKFELTNGLIQKTFSNKKPYAVPIVNGFIGSNDNGDITTLGRSGSDYTATIIGAALKANAVEIWTDVDGVLTADPKLVPNAITIKELSYEEATDMAFLGAKVVFPKSMEPVKSENIPILILNTYKPYLGGTFIGRTNANYFLSIKAITHLKDLSLISLNGISSEQNYRILPRLISIFKNKVCPMIYLNQSTTNKSISVLTFSKKISILINEINNEFKYELENKDVEALNFINDLALISIIGLNSENQTNSLKIFYEIFDKYNINCILFFNCSKNKNYSFLVKQTKVQKVVFALHESFFSQLIKINVA